MNIVYRNDIGAKAAHRCTLDQIMKIIKGSPKMKEQIDKIRAEKDKAIRSDLKMELKVFHLVDITNPAVGVAEGDIIQTGVMGFDVDLNYPGMDKYRADRPDVTPEDVAWAKEQIVKHKSCMYAFSSPSGGLKFAIKTDINHGGEDYHKFAYGKLKEVFDKKLVQVDNIDDLKHGVFFSYDADLYYNPDCEILELHARIEEDFNSNRERQIRARKANLARMEQLKGGVHRTDKAWDYVEREINKILAKAGEGNRDTSMYDVSQACFFAGFGVDIAAVALADMASFGLTNPDKRDLLKEAQRHHDWWMKKHGVPNARFFGVNTQETVKSYESLVSGYL